MLLPELRRAVCEANQALPKERLVTATSGNASGRDPETNYAVVKPSGVSFEDLTPETMLVVDLQCNEEQIGEAVVNHIGTCRAVLLQNHGVFTVGPDPMAAFKAAVMCEDVAKTVHLALLRGTPIPIPEEEVRRGYKRYQEKYGQK